jgi:hypothetical protein
MIVDPDFPDHWKTRMLVDSLDGDEAAPVYLLRLWAHCQNRRTAAFENLPQAALKALCRFPGHANKFESSLAASGFVRREDHTLIVIGWEEYNASLIANWTNGKKGGRPKKEPAPNPSPPLEKPMGNPSVTHGEPIREDKIGEDSSPPKPAKAVSAEGERFAEWFMTTLPPDTKPSSNWKTSWAKTYDDLIRLDGRTKAEIFRVCTWARQDAFWASNFMSPAKLRARDKANVLYFDVFAQRSKQPAQTTSSTPGLKPQVLANGEMFQPLFPGHRPDK